MVSNCSNPMIIFVLLCETVLDLFSVDFKFYAVTACRDAATVFVICAMVTSSLSALLQAMLRMSPE